MLFAASCCFLHLNVISYEIASININEPIIVKIGTTRPTKIKIAGLVFGAALSPWPPTRIPKMKFRILLMIINTNKIIKNTLATRGVCDPYFE